MARFIVLSLCLLLGGAGVRPLRAEGRRLPARASAENSAPGHGPELAVDSKDDSDIARQFRPRVTAEDVAIGLAWRVPPGVRPRWIRLYRTNAPNSRASQPLATLAAGAREYLDRVPNWTPRYYRLEAVDARGRVLLISDLAAAIARPAGRHTAPVETFAFWYEPYRPTTSSDASLKSIGNAAFVVGPGMEAAADLARAGKGLLPYVTFYQTAGWAGSFSKDAAPEKVAEAIAPIAFYRRSIRFPDSPPGYVPSVFCRPDNVEYNPRAIQYTTCPNSTRFRELVLAHVRRQLDGGVLGFFVDNGYDDDVAARSVCESTHHAHYYGDHLTSADAFLGLLLEVSCAVKQRHPDGVVMVNGGVPARASFYGLTLGDVCDGQLWESYLRRSYSTPREHVADWQQVYRRSIDLEKAWSAAPPRRMFVLSYPWDRGEAYFCCCTAKLCHLPWSACLGVSDPKHLRFGGHFGTYPELIDLRLGEPVHEREYGGTKQGEIYYREYERGMVVVNPTRTEQTAKLPLGTVRRYRDLFAGQDAAGDSLTLTIPAESGRVFLWKQ